MPPPRTSFSGSLLPVVAVAELVGTDQLALPPREQPRANGHARFNISLRAARLGDRCGFNRRGLLHRSPPASSPQGGFRQAIAAQKRRESDGDCAIALAR